jgi:hypothetical protein
VVGADEALLQPALQLPPLGRIRDEREGIAVAGGGLAEPAQAPEEIGLRGRQQVVPRPLAASLDLLQSVEPRLGSSILASRIFFLARTSRCCVVVPGLR